MKNLLRQSSLKIMSIFLLVTVITSIFIIVDSYSTTNFEDVLRNNEKFNNNGFFVNIPYYLDFNSFPFDNINQIIENLQSLFQQHELDTKIIFSSIDLNIRATIWFENGNEILQRECKINYFEPNQVDKLKDLLTNGSSLPQDPNNGLIVIPASHEQFFNSGETYNITRSSNSFTSVFPLNISGSVVIKDENQFNSNLEYLDYYQDIRMKTGIVSYGFERYMDITIFTEYKYFEQMIKNIGLTTGTDLRENSLAMIEYTLDLSGLTPKDNHNIIQNLNNIENILQKEYPGSYIDKNSFEGMLSVYQSHTYSLTMMLLVVTIPTILILGFLMKNVFSIQDSKKEVIVEKLKLRGFSVNQILLLLCTNFITIWIISYICGFFFGIIFSKFILNLIYHQNLSQYNIESSLQTIFLFSGTYPSYLFVRNLLKVRKIYLTGVSTNSEKSKPFSSSKTPIFILIFGIIGFCIAVLFEKNMNNLSLIFSMEILGMIFFILNFMVFILFLLGLIFSIKFVFIQLFQFLSSFLWPNRGGKILNIAIKNINRNKKEIFGFWSIVVILIVFVTTISTFIVSTENYFQNYSEYDVGAKYRIKYLKENESYLINYMNNHSKTQNAISRIIVTSIYYRFKTVYNPYGGSISYFRVKLMGIDPSTFFKVVNYRKIQIPGLETLMNKIENDLSIDNTSTAVSQAFIEKEGLQTGEKYLLNTLIENTDTSVEDYSYKPLVNLTISSSFTLFPIIVNPDLLDEGIIMDYGILEDIKEMIDNNTKNDFNIQFDHYLLINSNLELSNEQLDDLKTEIPIDIQLREEKTLELKERHSWNPIKDVLRINFFFSVIILVGCIFSLIIYRSAKSTREHSIERVLGLTKTEIFHLIFYEEGLILSSALFSGILLGLFVSGGFSFSLMINFYFGDTFLPKTVLYSYPDMFIWLMTVIIVVVPSMVFYIAKKQSYDIGLLLKYIGD